MRKGELQRLSARVCPPLSPFCVRYKDAAQHMAFVEDSETWGAALAGHICQGIALPVSALRTLQRYILPWRFLQ